MAVERAMRVLVPAQVAVHRLLPAIAPAACAAVDPTGMGPDSLEMFEKRAVILERGATRPVATGGQTIRMS